MAPPRTRGPAATTGSRSSTWGTTLRIRRGGSIVDAFPYDGTSAIELDGGAGDDTFIADFSGANPIPAGGLFIRGGQSPNDNDQLQIQGGSLTSLEYRNFTSAGSGRLIVNGDTAAPIDFTQLEPITVTSQLDTVTITVSDTVDQTVTFTRDTVDTSRTRVAGNAGSEPMTFARPGSRTHRPGAIRRITDTFVFNGFGSGFAAPITADTRASTAGQLWVNTPLNLGSGTLTGAVRLTAERIELQAADINTSRRQYRWRHYAHGRRFPAP